MKINYDGYVIERIGVVPYSYNIGVNGRITRNVNEFILSIILDCELCNVDMVLDELAHDGNAYSIVFTMRIVDWSIEQEKRRCDFLDTLEIEDIGEYAEKSETDEKWINTKYINKLTSDRALRKAVAFT